MLAFKLFLFVLMLLVGGIHDFYIGMKSIDEMQESSGIKLKMRARWTGMLNLMLALITAFFGVVLSKGGF